MSKKKAKPQTLTVKAKDNKEVCGSDNNDYMYNLLQQIMDSVWLAYADESTANERMSAAIASLQGIKPRDEIEGMMAAQMVGLHNAAMECMRRAMIKDQTHVGRSDNLNQANKLTRSYAALVEALSRYRGKGEQKMVVEHVHIHPGGQAIVGNVTQQPKEGGGIPTESEEQPHATAIEHNPGETLPCQNPQGQQVPIPRHV